MEGMRHYGYFVCNEFEPWVMICCAEEFMAKYGENPGCNTLYWIELDRIATEKFLKLRLDAGFNKRKAHPRDKKQIIIPVKEEEIGSPMIVAERVLKIASAVL
jgi:hypothetical protein